MTRQTRLKFQVGSAVGMLVAGMSLTIAGFIVPPLGDISDSVLWVLGQCLIYAGSIFGVGYYVDGKFGDLRKEMLEQQHGRESTTPQTTDHHG